LGVVHEREARYEGIVSRARSLTETLAIPVTDALMYEELGLVSEGGLIENTIQEVVDRNRDLILYVVVTDRAGRVTHSNRWELLGRHFPRALDPDSVGKEPVTEIIRDPDDGAVLEVRTTLNISTKCWGSLVAGYSLKPVEQTVQAIARRVAVIALILMMGNSVLTALYVEKLIRPILSLNATMKRAGRGDLSVRADESRKDEVGELGEAFNRMMDELEEARELDSLRQSQLAHTEKMAAVGALAAGVAHEVSNPLAGILACLENLERDPRDEEMRKRYLGLVRDGLKRIERTIQNLLDFSRPREMRLEPTSLNHNLRHVVELVEYQLRKRKIEVRMELAAQEPIVLADHFQMEQLFLNLVLNAVQSMPGGGLLTLRTGVSEGTVEAEVEDTGPGIDPAIRERIFDPFFTTREVGEGTGLGLAVSDSIVRAHGGTIDVESEEGHGALFRVRLPLRARGEERGRMT
ncbi:MAG: ATP-binding protein, partial [Gemmatimonadota bacterium]